MAILTVAGLALVGHSSGGVILSYGGSYLAGTYVGANVVSGFVTAAGVLSQVGAAAGGVMGGVGAAATATASSPALPVIAGVAAIAVIAGGAYCYLHGIPAPVVEMLGATGVGTATAKGFTVTVGNLAPALIALGLSGYLAYEVYKDYKSFKADHKARILNPTGNSSVDSDAYPYAFDKQGRPRKPVKSWLFAKWFKSTAKIEEMVKPFEAKKRGFLWWRAR